MRWDLIFVPALLLFSMVNAEDEEKALLEALDQTLTLASGSLYPSQNVHCVQNMKALMNRSGMPINPLELRHNLTDAALLRLSLLASIALISPWDQDPVTGYLLISNQGVMVEAYHPSASESDIMLCAVCSLLAIIVMFHVTAAQQQQLVATTPGPEGPKKG